MEIVCEEDTTPMYSVCQGVNVPIGIVAAVTVIITVSPPLFCVVPIRALPLFDVLKLEEGSNYIAVGFWRIQQREQKVRTRALHLTPQPFSNCESVSSLGNIQTSSE